MTGKIIQSKKDVTKDIRMPINIYQFTDVVQGPNGRHQLSIQSATKEPSRSASKNRNSIEPRDYSCCVKNVQIKSSSQHCNSLLRHKMDKCNRTTTAFHFNNCRLLKTKKLTTPICKIIMIPANNNPIFSPAFSLWSLGGGGGGGLCLLWCLGGGEWLDRRDGGGRVGGGGGGSIGGEKKSFPPFSCE